MNPRIKFKESANLHANFKSFSIFLIILKLALPAMTNMDYRIDYISNT